MREIRKSGSEGGGAAGSSYPYQQVSRVRCGSTGKGCHWQRQFSRVKLSGRVSRAIPETGVASGTHPT
jgi:hypothetical protein